MLQSIATLKEQFPGIAAYSLSTVGQIRMLKKLLAEQTHYIDQLYTDFSVVLFRPYFILVSEEYLMKTHKNQ